MTKKLYKLLIIGIVFQFISACSTSWTQAIQAGDVAQQQFSETLNIELENGFIFVPVSIEGKKYRFLFDTGAPFSISKKLQDDHQFKMISKGNLVDSDHNKTKIKWSQVESIRIGNVSFENQTAFIGDFEANPILKCLGIDGIIGSNLQRHANWTIDQNQGSLILYKGKDAKLSESTSSIPFTTDHQYNIFININIGQAKVKNILIDYGSNGSIALSDALFATLKNAGVIDKTFEEKGTQQSGLVGQSVDLNREFTYSDAVTIAAMDIQNTKIQTGKTTSVGNRFLSNLKLTIDWDSRKLHLLKTEQTKDTPRFPGFKLGYSEDLGVYVQSVVRQSDAFEKGVRPYMKVHGLDDLNFDGPNDFCDYIQHKLNDHIALELTDSSGSRKTYHFEQTNVFR